MTALRREVSGVESQGISVLRFAHRHSVQPLASDRDSREATETIYLAESRKRDLFFAFLRRLIRSPKTLIQAFRFRCAFNVSPLRFQAYLMMASRLYEILKSAGVDRLHSHFAGNASMVAMLCRSLGGPQWSLTVHGPEDIAPANLPRLAALMRLADPILTISEHTAAAVKRLPGMESRRVHVMPMGVSSKHLLATKPVPAAAPLLCVARLEQRKGVHHLIQAFDMVCGSMPALSLRVVGDGPMWSALIEQLEPLRCRELVKLCGWKNEQEVIDLLDECRLLVLPSLSEGLPVCILEAFARSRPVVATDIPGVRELFDNAGGGGCLVAPGDPDSLAQSILTMASKSPEELFSIGSIGRKYVARYHDADRNGEHLKQLWTKHAALSE